MKIKLLILLFAVSIISCNKDDTSKVSDSDPKVTGVQFSSVFSGGSGNGLKCKVTIEVPDELLVDKMIMAQEGSVSGDVVSGPKTGTYELVHLTSTYPFGKKYYFLFMKSNKVVYTSELYTVK